MTGTGEVISVSTVVSLTVLLVAYFYNSPTELDNASEMKKFEHILDAMLKVEEQSSVGDVNIAVGYGACRDLFVRGSEVLTIMTPPDKTSHYGRIESLSQLKEMYAMFFSAGSAAERFVSNEELFAKLVSSAEKAPGSYYALGGNAPVMAQRFAQEGAKVLLAARQGQYTMSHIHNNIQVAGHPSSDGDDDIHLIMEYIIGDSWGPYTAPRANRFIIHSDANNPKISSAEEFGKKLQEFNPNLLVVSGLQMMDNFPFVTGEREDRLLQVKKQMTTLPETTRIHFEMASFTDTELLENLMHFVLPYADSLGMNEQELPNLYNILKYGNISIISDFNPRVAAVLDQMRDIFSLLNDIQDEDESGQRNLTRLHVHTLAFQAIMVKKSSKWRNIKAAATKAALTANRHVCGKSKIDLKTVNLLMDDGFTLSETEGSKRMLFEEDNPVSCWSEEEDTIEVCVAPVFVCRAVKQTAGGGDNISAAGLVLQV